MRELTFHVPGMHCAACEAGVRKSVERLKGIERVDVDLTHKHVTVRFDDGQTDDLAVKAQIEKAGFEVG
jgi:copper chaperone CopZ